MHWMDILTIVGTLGSFMFWLFSKLDSDIKSQSNDMRAQMQRIDQLYVMYCETQKEIKDLHIDFIKSAQVKGKKVAGEK